MSTCPVCQAEQGEGLLCHSCTTATERDLGDVAAIVAELDVALSKMARIGTPSKGGLARERMPYNQGASIAAGVLENVLTTWVRDLTNDQWRPGLGHTASTAAAAHMLMLIPEIRRHPAVDELVDQVGDAIRQARHEVDRPADRVYLSRCGAVVEGVRCVEELYARPNAVWVRCNVCSTEYDVADRRQALLDQASGMLFTVPEASRMMGAVGRITVTEDRIRGYLRRHRLAYHTDGLILLGDLMAIVADDSAKAEQRAS